MHATTVLATVTGRDRTGVTAAFFAALAAHDIEIRDVEQVSIRNRLTLSVLFDVHGDTMTVRNTVPTAADALGLECEIAVADQDRRPAAAGWDGERMQVTVLGRRLRPGAVGHVAQCIADAGGNIDTLHHEPAGDLAALGLTVRGGSRADLTQALLEAAQDSGVDIAIEPVRLRRSAIRLVLLDATLGAEAAEQPTAAALIEQLQRAGYRTSAGTDTTVDQLADDLGVSGEQVAAVCVDPDEWKQVAGAGLVIASAPRRPGADDSRWPAIGYLLGMDPARGRYADVAG